MTKPFFQCIGWAVVLACSVVRPDAASAQARPTATAPQSRPAAGAPAARAQSASAPAGPRAGSITALLPVAKITRGTGRNRAILEAKKGDNVVYNDLVRTEKGGRARITLADQSILSLGSQAELRIIRHDARTQQTTLQLGYGRVRAEVASVTRDRGRFELRTPTAVAGVIGTDFGADSSIPGVTSFICISGLVEVSNADANVPGKVPCPAGSTTTVSTGLPPTAPQPATPQQIQQLIQDTEPSIISGLSPASALIGTEVMTAATGSKLDGINGVSINGSGVTVALQGTPTGTTAEVKVVIAPDAAPGVRTLTFTKPNGQTAAAVIHVLATPQKRADGTTRLDALKKLYLEIIEQERQSAIAGANALGIGVQQSAADTQEALENENNRLQPPLPVPPVERDIQGDVAPMIQAMTVAGTAINVATADTREEIDRVFAEAQRRITESNATPTDDEKLRLAKEIFERLNAPLMNRYKTIHDRLGAVARGVNARLSQTMARWMENFKVEAARQRSVPIPRVDAEERSYELGLMASFDAARSTPTAGASIANFNWVLCDPAYRPQQIGVPLSPTDTRCQPMAGYASTSSDFKFPTCELNAQDHIARVTVTDTNNRATAMDVRVRILPPQYEGPGVRLRSLSNAYEQLQLHSFLGFFDESFSGLTELQESIRRTFTALASMNINLRLSQAAMGCNEATVRADWEQAYTFKDDLTCANVLPGTICQRVIFKQLEQLTVRMKRIPGKNWYITEFQGDNGTVQGTPPGPIQRDTSLPDLRIASLTPGAITTVAAAGPADNVIGVAPGANGFAAVVENIGTADLTTAARVRFVARDGNGNTLATDVRDLSGPLAVGGSATVIGQLNVPDLGPGVGARIFAIVNPGCVVSEQNCDGGNAKSLEIIIGVVDLQVIGFTPVGTLIGTVPGQVDVQIKNLGSRTSTATTGNLRMLFGTTLAGSDAIPAIAPGATVTTPLQFTPPNLAGTQPVTIAIAPASPGELNPTNDNLAGSLTLTAAVVDLKTSSLAFSGSAPPFLSGETLNVTLNVQNTGNRPSVATNLLACRLAGTAGTQNFAAVPLTPIAAGATATGLAYSFIVPPNFSGNDTLTCGVSQDPFEAAAAIADNQVSLAMLVGLNVDLQLVNVPAPAGADQMGGAASVTFGVKNFGLDTAPAGWNVVLTIDGNQVGSVVAPGDLPGLATAPVTINYTTPNVAPAPADVNVPATLQVNVNAAIAETNTANNTFSASLRLVDFTITAASPGGTAVVGRSLLISPAVQVAPTTYPLAMTMTYANLPGGVVGSGTPFGQDISGTPGATGSFSIGAGAMVDGVTRVMTSSIPLQVVPEISLSLGTAFASLQSGGAAQTLQVNVTGGIYPVTVTLGTLPTGITTLSPISVVLTGPGVVAWNISADLTATAGSFIVTVQGTDSGVPATGTAGGNVSFPFNGSVNGQANYIISNAVFAAPHTNGLGADALQVGETAQLVFSVQNVGNLTQAGTVFLSFTNTCAGPTSSSVPAPAAGATESGLINIPISCAPGTYNQSASITAGTPPESDTGDNSVGPVSFEVFDYTVTNAAPLAEQNVPLAGLGIVSMALTESGPPAPLALPLVVSNGGKALTNPTSTSVSPGSIPIQVTAAGGTLSGDTEIINAQITRFGVSKSDIQNVRFYTAAVNNITSGQPGSSASNPIPLPIGASGTFVDFKLVGDFGGSANFQLPVVTGFSINLGGAPPSLPNDTFTLQVDAIAGAPTVVTAIPIVFTIPATIPAQTVSTTLYVQAYAIPDVAVTAITPTGTNFSSRNFTTHPVLSGEGGDLSITISNIGAGPSTAGLPLQVNLFGGLPVNVNQVTVPSIPASSSITLTVHVRVPDYAPTLATSWDVQLGADPLETNTANNLLSLAVQASDWDLSVTGNGSSGVPLNILVPTPGSGSTTVQVDVFSLGAVFTPIQLGTGVVSTYMTSVIPGTILASQPVTIVASTSPVAPNGEYTVQVLAKMMDGASVTAVRSLTIHVTVNGGAQADTVTITASPNNALTGFPSSCTGPCTPLQIDGLLVETVTLTATRSGGTSGATDLVFSDDGSTIISRVTTSGSPQVQQLAAVPYNTPVPVNFAADEGVSGILNDGPGYSVVSATAVTTAQRGAPPLEPVGSQQTTLYFNVGDIDINLACIDFGPGESQPVSIPILNLSGFSKPISWQWISTGGLNVSIINPTGSSAAPPYANINSTFVNNETSNILTVVNFVLAISISNGNGTATKYFNVAVYPFSTGCAFGAGRAAAGRADESLQRSYWKRGPVSSTSAVRMVERLAVAAALPDLQIKPVDVSMSPSIPQLGDTLEVRFKLVNAGEGTATEVPVALQVNGVIVATETYSLKAGASTLGGFQWKLETGDAARERPTQIRTAAFKGSGVDGDGRGIRRPGGITAQLLIDPAGSHKQKTTGYKTVALTKAGIVPVDAMVAAAERVYLEMNTICSGFRISSGAVVDCDAGADLDITIEDFKSARFTLNAALGIADLGAVEPNRADASDAQFLANARLILGHTYAVQMSGGRVGYVKFSASLTPRQLAAEAKLRFGLNGVRILKKLGGDTGSTNAGDVAGRISADVLMYFDMTFRP